MITDQAKPGSGAGVTGQRHVQSLLRAFAPSCECAHSHEGAKARRHEGRAPDQRRARTLFCTQFGMTATQIAETEPLPASPVTPAPLSGVQIMITGKTMLMLAAASIVASAGFAVDASAARGS